MSLTSELRAELDERGWRYIEGKVYDGHQRILKRSSTVIRVSPNATKPFWRSRSSTSPASVGMQALVVAVMLGHKATDDVPARVVNPIRKIRVCKSDVVGHCECSGCGAIINARDRFCWNCGARFEEEE